MANSILNQSYSQGVKRIVGSRHSIEDFKVPDKVINERKTKWFQIFDKYIQLTQTLEDEEEDAVSLYSCEYPSTGEKTGASSTPNVWENRLRFRKSLSCTESWVDASIQYTKVQTRSPSSACDGVGHELENVSTIKLSDIEPNQNTIREKSLCNNSTALGEHLLCENGSILTSDSPIRVITCLNQVSDKPLVYKTLGDTDDQAELLKSDCFGSHLSREKLNRSNSEQPLIESILSPESVSAMYLNKLHSHLSEAKGDNSEGCTGIPSGRPNACKYSEKHKVGSSASFASLDNGNIRLKESSQKKEQFSLKRSNDASISSSCKKQKLVEEIEARVLSALSEESTSRSSIDLNTSNVKNAHIDAKKMSSTNSPAVPKVWPNVSLPPYEHPDIVSSNGNSLLISKRTDGNKYTLEKEDPQNINFSPEEFIDSDPVRNRSVATSKYKNRHTDKIENSSGINCSQVILDSEIAKVNDSFKMAEVTHCLTTSRRTGSQPKPDQGLKTNSSLMLSSSHDYMFITHCRNIRSHESSLAGSSALRNQNRLITPRMMKSFTLENTNLWDFDRNTKHKSILSLPGEKKLQEVPSGANSSLRSKFSTGPLKIKETPYRNICVGKSIQTLNACDVSKEDMSNLCTIDSISKSCHKKKVTDGGIGEDMINKIKASVFLNYMTSGPSTAHETFDGNNTPNLPKRKKRYSLVMDTWSDECDTKPSKTTNNNSRKSRNCKIVRSPSCKKEIMLGSTKQKIVSGKPANLIKIDSKMAENSKRNRNSFEHGLYPTALQSEIFLDENSHSLQGHDSILHSSGKNISVLSLLNVNDASKQTHGLRGNKRDKMPETSTGAFNCNIIPCEHKKKNNSPKRIKESISKRNHIIPCDLKKKNNSPGCIKEIISNRKPFECQSFTHLYAIGDKPSKMNRSKLKKLRKIFMDKVTDQRLKKSNVCSENKIDTKNIIRSSDSRLYLSHESLGEKQFIKQSRSTGEENENNNRKISELLYRENRTKPCSPIAAVSTNSQSFNIERESNSNIFTDILLSEDIFTVSKRVSNKNNKKLDQASIDSSPKARLIKNQSLKLVSPISQKLTNRLNSEDKTQKKFVLAHEKLSTSNIYKRQRDASFTTFGCEEETTPGSLPRSDAEMMDDNIEKMCIKEVLDSSSCISSHKQDCKELAERKEKIDFEDKIDERHSSILPSASYRNKSSDEDNFSLIQHCNRKMESKIQKTSFKTKINPIKSSSDEDISPTIESCNNKNTHSKTRINPIKSSSDEDNFPLLQYCNQNMKTKIQKTSFKTKINLIKSSSDEDISPIIESCNNKKTGSKTRINPTKSSSDVDISPTIESCNNKKINSKTRINPTKSSSDVDISPTIESCNNKNTHSKTKINPIKSSSDEDNSPLLQYCNQNMKTKIQKTGSKTRINPTKSSSDVDISPTIESCNNKKINSKTRINPTKSSSDVDISPTIESCNNKKINSKTRINPTKRLSDLDISPTIESCNDKKINSKTRINPTKSSSDVDISPTIESFNNKNTRSKTRINPTKSSSDEDISPTIGSCNNKNTRSKTRINPTKSSSDVDISPTIESCNNKNTRSKTRINPTKSSSDENISPTIGSCNNKKIRSKTRINPTKSSSDVDISSTMESWNDKKINSKSRNFFSKSSSDEVISQTIENCNNKKTHSKTKMFVNKSSSDEDIYPTIEKFNKVSQTKPHYEKAFPIMQNSTKESKTEFKIGLPKTKLSFSECISTDEEIEHSNKERLKCLNTYSKNKINHKKYSSLTEYSTAKQKPNEHIRKERKVKKGEKLNITKIVQKFKSNGNSNVLKKPTCATKGYFLSDESVSSKPQHERHALDNVPKSCSKITYVNNKSKPLGSLCEYSSCVTQKRTNRVKNPSIKSQCKTSTENSQPTLVDIFSTNETHEHSSLLSESNNSGISEESISLDDSETWSDWCRRVSRKHLSKTKT